MSAQAKASSSIKTVAFTKATGRMTRDMVTASSAFQMEMSMKVSTTKVKFKAKVSTFGRMVTRMTATGMTE